MRHNDFRFMNVARRRQINEMADEIREILELSIPVNVKEAVEKLKGVLESSDLEHGMEARISKEGARFKIQISNEKIGNRERFSIAHELGHLFLHMGYLIHPEKWNGTGEYIDSVYYRYGHSVEEHEANEFAGAFLMPTIDFEEAVREALNEGRYYLPGIADHFQVSVEAVRSRGRWLGLFRWR